jgi:N-acetylglucosaminyl-diphospho-decaprenol L-rhamnosyltransferase
MKTQPIPSEATEAEARVMALSIIIVSYETRDMTLECLRSLFRETGLDDFEVLVVDNASKDGSAAAIAEEFPSVHLMALDENVGFGRANNLAAERARGGHLLLLNPDTVVLRDAVGKLMEFAANRPKAGIWGGRTLFGDERLNASSCWGAPSVWSTFCLASGVASLLPTSALLNPEALGRWKRDSVRAVDIVSGCFLLITKSYWDQLDGFHSDFFMYGEDADLCLRGARLGVRPIITPDAEIVHYAGASERVRGDKMVRLFIAKAQLCKKFWNPARGWIGVRLLDFWALHRCVAFWVLSRFYPGRRAALDEWRSVWRRRDQWHGAFSKTRRYADEE